MIFISYYTKNTPYETVIVENLIPTLELHNLEYDIQAIDDQGSWQKNTAYKSTLIKEMLIKHKQPVCFLDSDAQILKYPELLINFQSAKYDLAYHHFNWFGHWRGQWDNKTNIQLLSGTMVFNYNPTVMCLLDEWIEKVYENVNVWEQKVLEQIVNEKSDLSIQDLPAEYCCVIMQNGDLPNYVKSEEVCILHTQASRKYKNWWRDEDLRRRKEKLK